MNVTFRQLRVFTEVAQQGSMARPPKEIATRAKAFAAHALVFVAPPGHSLLRVGHAPVAALEGHAFIVRELGSGTRATMEAFFAEHRFEPRITMEMWSNETIKQAVMARMGLSFLSLHTMGLEVHSGLLHVLDIEGTPLVRMWNVVQLQAKLLPPAAEAFPYIVIERGDAHLLAHDAPLLRRSP